jgi:flavin-binding protein dodecin
MPNHVYKTIELTGSSTSSSDDAVKSAITKAAKTVRGMRWFQVTESRGHIERDKIDHWQVTIKVGFALDD